VDEVFVAADRVANLLVPLQEGRLRDRLRQLRNLHFYEGHSGLLRNLDSCAGRGATASRPVRCMGCGVAHFFERDLPSPKAAAISSFCWAKCLSKYPTAGEADAARPA